LKNIRHLATFCNKYPLQRDIFCMCEALLLFGWLLVGLKEGPICRNTPFGLVFCSGLIIVYSAHSHKCSYIIVSLSLLSWIHTPTKGYRLQIATLIVHSRFVSPMYPCFVVDTLLHLSLRSSLRVLKYLLTRDKSLVIGWPVCLLVHS
jgi:hypothetical protein